MDRRSRTSRLGLGDTFAEDPVLPPKPATDATAVGKIAGPDYRIAPHTIEAAKRDSIAALQEASSHNTKGRGFDALFDESFSGINRDSADHERNRAYKAEDASNLAAILLGLRPAKTSVPPADSAMPTRRSTSLDDEVAALMSGIQRTK